MNWEWAGQILFSWFGLILVLVVLGIAFVMAKSTVFLFKAVGFKIGKNKIIMILIGYFVLLINVFFIQEEVVAVRAYLGDANSQIKLGYWLSNGMGIIKRNENRSIYWFNIAANQNNAIAQKYLGYSYETGAGIEKNLMMARYWYSRAAQNGDNSARERLSRVEKELK